MGAIRYTAEQLKVIRHQSGHAAVSAVPGSGKSQAIVGRVEYLLEAKPRCRIVVIMFGKHAADSLLQRVREIGGSGAVEVRTLHSMGYRLTRRFVELGYLEEAKVETDARVMRHMAAATLSVVYARKYPQTRVAPDGLVDEFVAYVHRVKTDTQPAAAVAKRLRDRMAKRCFAEAFSHYEAERLRRKIRFEDDLLYDPVRVLTHNAAARELVANRIDHLIVDEAQDLNPIQIALVRYLAGERAQVMLVGDEDQCIFDWLGANPSYLIRGVKADFPDIRHYRLTRTFRYGHIPALAASQLIAHNGSRTRKISVPSKVEKRTTIGALSLAHGFVGLGAHIKQLLDHGSSPDKLAVLLRTYDVVSGLELELAHQAIPYQLHHDATGEMHLPLIAARSALLLATGQVWRLPAPEKETALRALLSYPVRTMPSKSMSTVVRECACPDDLRHALNSIVVPGFVSESKRVIMGRGGILDTIAGTGNQSPCQILRVFFAGMDGPEKPLYGYSTPRDKIIAFWANVEMIEGVAERFAGTTEPFIALLNRVIDADESTSTGQPSVWIGSIHKAKGMQWPIVFVPGLVGGYFPRDQLSRKDLEAERRLCYVAMTRASEKLFVAYPPDDCYRASLQHIDRLPERPADSPVSRFLWESNLGVACHAAMAIGDKGHFSPVALTQPEIANQYFKNFEVSKAWRYEKREPIVNEPSSELVECTRCGHG
ncbi:MAG: ATP-dependent helicase [Xanthomonadales bacterium]|nr:ATP-dependent helicase [Xanthomonadales bacterium]